MRIKPRHRRLVAHYLRYATDKRDATDAEIAAFITWESTGKTTAGVDVSRILVGKQAKELFLKMVTEEVFSYWANGWGWGLPLVSIIDDPETDGVLKSNCQALFDSLDEDLLGVLLRHTQFSPKQKLGWVTARPLLDDEVRAWAISEIQKLT